MGHKRCMPQSRRCHRNALSIRFIATILRPGDSQKAIIYDVENLRDGQRFSARRVKAVQNGKFCILAGCSEDVEAA